MKKVDFWMIGALLFLALFIWFRDTSWMSSSDDTLPILVALPVFVWLGWPWSFYQESPPLKPNAFIIPIVIFLAGIVTNLTLLLTLSWVWLLWVWLKNRLDPSTHSSVKKLLILPLMAFPWVALDAGQLGWWFRLSGAWVTAQVFSFLGSNVVQEGTNLLINGLPISVEAACAGLNTLQSMLIAGTVVAYVILGHTNRYWWNLPVLIAMAWLANTLRIVVLSFAALFFGTNFAMGSFHTWGGWLVLMLMFVFCYIIFALQEPENKTTNKGNS